MYLLQTMGDSHTTVHGFKEQKLTSHSPAGHRSKRQVQQAKVPPSGPLLGRVLSVGLGVPWLRDTPLAPWPLPPMASPVCLQERVCPCESSPLLLRTPVTLDQDPPAISSHQGPLLADPISRHDYIHRYEGLGLQHDSGDTVQTTATSCPS